MNYGIMPVLRLRRIEQEEKIRPQGTFRCREVIRGACYKRNEACTSGMPPKGHQVGCRGHRIYRI